MTPFQFGDARRRALGLLHRPDTPKVPSTGVLLCNPLGQEAVRSHRLYRVLADRLARAGHHVLRFDYHGTGDSAGEDGDGELDGWQRDIEAAHDELQARSGCARVLWVGARLGATLALMASARVPRPPDGVLAWDPILSGRAYLQRLADCHADALRTSYSIVPAGIELHPVHEAMGFALGVRLREQLAALDATRLDTARAALRLIVTPTVDAAAAARIGSAAGAGATRTIAFDHAFEWNSEEAIYTSPLVPPDGLRMLVEQVEQL